MKGRSYELTGHARDVLAKRQISVAWMEQVLNEPEATSTDQMDPELEHRLGRIGEHGDRVLRVILNVRRTPVRIVTVFFDRRRTLP